MMFFNKGELIISEVGVVVLVQSVVFYSYTVIEKWEKN